MVRSKLSVVVPLILVGATSSTAARTWTVERDGSGDYAVIQDAVNAAAEGDTIRIGPGRYDEGEVYSCPGWTEFVRVLVNKPNLTLIGAGPTTIIGQPQPWDSAQGEHRGIVAGAGYGSPGRLDVCGIAFENIYMALYTENIDVAVTNCDFLSNCYGCALLRGATASIRSCRYIDMTRNGTHVVCWSQERLEISSCTFVLDDIPTGAQSHIGFEGVQDGLIENCQFRDGVAGIGLSAGARTTIRNCVFDGQNNGAIDASLGSHLNVEDSIFRNQRAAMYSLVLDNVVTVSRCLIEDVEDCSFKFGYIGSLTVNNCDLARGREGVVVIEERFDPCIPQVIDMTNNYWGTDNPDSIQAWIFDATDSNRACYVIDYEPFRSESTPGEKTSMGGIKSLFR